jgi:hypothetical protein
MLLLFNLIPGYPLDGGRILRAVVWHLSGSEKTGWRTAMVSGQIVSFGFMGVGAFQILQGDAANGIWLIFIGWFLQNATAAEQTAKTVTNQLAGATVRQAMAMTDEPRVPGRMKVRQLIDDHVLTHGQNLLPGRRRGDPARRRDADPVTQVPRDKWDWTSVSDVMTPWASLSRVEAGRTCSTRCGRWRRASSATCPWSSRTAGWPADPGGDHPVPAAAGRAGGAGVGRQACYLPDSTRGPHPPAPSLRGRLRGRGRASPRIGQRTLDSESGHRWLHKEAAAARHSEPAG